MTDIAADVNAFHNAMELPSRRNPDKPPVLIDTNTRLALITEEVGELVRAIAKQDLVESVDAVVDLIYVAVGTLDRWGVDFDAVWEEVHRSNMAKVGGKKDAAGKLQKPEGWEPPDVAGAMGVSR